MRVGKPASVAAVALALAVLGCKRAARPEPASSTPKPVRPQSDKRIVPALSAGEDEGLGFAVETTRLANPPGRRLRLSLGKGDVTLTLFDPPPERTDLAFGRGEMLSPSAASGAAVVGAVARWLHQRPPAAAKTPGVLRPFGFQYVLLGSDAEWEANKLFLQDGSRDAEVYLNVRADGKRAFLLENDEDYRPALVSLLATALRDGKPPRTMSGPELAGPDPLVRSLSPIVGPGKIVQPQAWAGGAWIAVVDGGASNRVLLWKDLAKEPRLLADVKGAVTRLAVSPRRDRVALLVIHARQAGSMSSDDPADVQIVALEGGPARTLVSSQPDFTPGMMSVLVWSPDGAALAVNGTAAGKPPAPSLTRAYDVATGRVLAGTRPAPASGIPVRWDDDAVVLLSWGKKGRETLDWRPGKGEPTPRRHDVPLLHSPDGRYTVAFRTSGLEIADPGGHRSFRARGEDDRTALAAIRDNLEEAPWLGAGGLALESDATMALDLATAKLRYLFPEGEFQFVSASEDGERVVARDAEARLLWGRVAR